jgi:hypothetical protein
MIAEKALAANISQPQKCITRLATIAIIILKINSIYFLSCIDEQG